ncbi:MAG: DNA N-6-adenine-methyltransferase [Candidatus Binataceae bacterium]
MEFYAAEIRMRAERKAGQLLIEARLNRTRRIKGQSHVVGNDMMLPRIEDLGISRDEAARWQRIAKLSPRDFEARLARLRTGKSFLSAAFSSDSEEWLTPKEVLDLAVGVLGAIDLDPCAERSDARANVPAMKFFTKKDDGLSKVWHGRVFMNPPYGAAITAFVEKLIASWRETSVTEAIALLPSRTDTAWFRAIVAVAPVCFVMGRIMFKRATGEVDSDTTAPFPSAIFYLGSRNRLDRFASEFGDFGPICETRS